MSRFRCYLILGFVLLLTAGAAVCWSVSRHEPKVPGQCAGAGRAARIDPDYSDCTIPPNIAPLNFVIKEDGIEYRVRVHSQRGRPFVVGGRSAAVQMPLRKWKDLVGLNRGNDLFLDVYVRDRAGTWRRFKSITNRIAHEQIDGYLVYRLLKPVYEEWRRMGIYQRNVQNFREDRIIVSTASQREGCINCHTFIGNDPSRMALQMRPSPSSAMLLARNGRVSKIDTRTKFNPSPAAYMSWHPTGKVIAFSVNRVRQVFHSIGDVREVADITSDLGIYDVQTGQISSTGAISRPQHLETFPCWSPDGRHLYFCSAPKWHPGATHLPASYKGYKFVRYDLMRIRYNPTTGKWGKLERVLSANDVDGSITQPRISPDGRFLLFCVADYGSFPVHAPSSDLYMIDLRRAPNTKRHWRLQTNSDRSESWHCWSSNGRWIVFASRRRSGQFGRLYLSYIDRNGIDHKPVLLPREDPTFYDSCLDNYHVPELITGPVTVTERDLRRAMYSSEKGRAAGVVSGATPKAGTSTEPASAPSSPPPTGGYR